MAHDLSLAYPGKVVIDSNNPRGTFKNRTSDVLKDGTPLERIWQTDVWGFLSHILKKLEIEPNEIEENESVSQYFDGLKKLFNSVPGISKNLVLIKNTTNPNYQIDIDANTIILKNADNLSFSTGLVNLTVDITQSGVNGLDTGTEAASTYYYIYVIYNPITQDLAGLFSINPSSPTLPSGYDFYEPIGKVFNNASSNFDSPVSINKIKRNKTYFGNGTDFTVTGTSWTTTFAIAEISQNDIGMWIFDFYITGTVPNISRSLYDVTISGISSPTFDQSFVSYVTSQNAMFCPKNNTPLLLRISHAPLTIDSYFYQGKIFLAGKPTWV